MTGLSFVWARFSNTILIISFSQFFWQAAGKFLGENDRVKLLVLYCAEEDEALAKAASGTLAYLSQTEEVCNKILQVSDNWVIGS